MAFVGKEFQHDIFVSYYRGGGSLLGGYSQEIIEQLERELTQNPAFGGELKFFWDANDLPEQGFDLFDPLHKQLCEAVSSSALLIVLMSPQYLGSNWCADERSYWYEAQKSIGFDTRGRTPIVQLWPTGEREWPPEFSYGERPKDLILYFYDENSREDPNWPFSWDSPTTYPSDEFRNCRLKLAGALVRRLGKIQERLDAKRKHEAARVKLAKSSGQTIYLYGRESQEAEWTNARDILRAAGFKVAALRPQKVEADPDRFTVSKNSRINAIKRSDAILVLANDDANALQDDILEVGIDNRREATEDPDILKPCGVLDVNGIGRREPDFIDYAEQFEIDWLDATPQPWISAVQDWLREAAKE